VTVVKIEGGPHNVGRTRHPEVTSALLSLLADATAARRSTA
jgi:hypothetical protein